MEGAVWDRAEAGRGKRARGGSRGERELFAGRAGFVGRYDRETRARGEGTREDGDAPRSPAVGTHQLLRQIQSRTANDFLGISSSAS